MPSGLQAAQIVMETAPFRSAECWRAAPAFGAKRLKQPQNPFMACSQINTRKLTVRTFIRAITILLLAFCGTLLPAQVRQPDFSAYGGSIPAKINGVIQVAAFDYDVPSDFAAAVGQWSNFSNGCSFYIPGYGSNQPFS